jgi:hypothetical protein
LNVCTFIYSSSPFPNDGQEEERTNHGLNGTYLLIPYSLGDGYCVVIIDANSGIPLSVLEAGKDAAIPESGSKA